MNKIEIKQLIEEQRQQTVKLTALHDRAGFLTKYFQNEIFSDLHLKMWAGTCFFNTEKKKIDDEIGYYLWKDYAHNSDNISRYKYVYAGVDNQADFEKLLSELNPELCAITFDRCTKVHDFSALENFPNLEFVKAGDNNIIKKLWNADKTPKISELTFNGFTKLDIATVASFSGLKYLFFAGATSIPSCDFLYGLKKLEQLRLNTKILSNDIRPILALENLKNYFVGDKNHKIIAKYLKDGTLPKPQPPSIYSDMPTSGWRENESTSFTKKQIKQIEKILADYCNAISSAESIETAKEITALCVNALNSFAEDIETIEREELFEYIVGKAKDQWHDQIVETIESTRDW